MASEQKELPLISTVKGDTLRPEPNDDAYWVTVHPPERLDCTDANISIQVRDSKKKLWHTLNPTIVIPDSNTIHIDLNEVINIPAGLYFYDIQITFTSGEVHTWLKGSMLVTQDYTY